MATMNFSVPDEVKERFNRVFAGRNKSAIVTQLLEEAIAQAEHQQRSGGAIDRILARRRAAPPTTDVEVQRVRDELRGDNPSCGSPSR